MISPQELFNLLSDETRLRCLILLQQKKEICVCEFCAVLKSIQPKISRHLAHLRKSGLVIDERRGQWVYYRLHEKLPKWMQKILSSAYDELRKMEPYVSDIKEIRDQGANPCGAEPSINSAILDSSR